MTKILRILLILNTLFLSQLHSQYFYNYEDFLADSSFILKHNIKVVTIRIPEILGDSASDIAAYQRLCYNPFGKLAWFEYDSTENNVRRKFYTWHFFDDNARRFKSRIFQRCEGRDSLREEIHYNYSPEGKLYQQQHYQIFIAAYREWAFSFEWQGDTLSIKTDDLGKTDTTRYNPHGLPRDFKRDNWHYLVDYDEKGRMSQMRYFAINEETTEETKIDDLHFFYEGDKLMKIETSSRVITYTYNYKDLPINSLTLDKFTGKKIGFEIFYDYEFKDDYFAKQTSK